MKFKKLFEKDDFVAKAEKEVIDAVKKNKDTIYKNALTLMSNLQKSCGNNVKEYISYLYNNDAIYDVFDGLNIMRQYDDIVYEIEDKTFHDILNGSIIDAAKKLGIDKSVISALEKIKKHGL